MFETIRKITRFIFWLDEREYLCKRRYPLIRADASPAGDEGGVDWVEDPDCNLSSDSEVYHEALKLAEKLKEQEREAEELKKLVKELEALERQLRALQEQCERAKREREEREREERGESEVAEEGEA